MSTQSDGPALPTVAHTSPCRECPFRRSCAPGWLGGGRVADWHADLTMGDTAFLCHMAVKKKKHHFCAGSMIHYRNSLKMPRDPEFSAAVAKYDKSDKVFTWAHEFKQHHEAGLLAQKDE